MSPLKFGNHGTKVAGAEADRCGDAQRPPRNDRRSRNRFLGLLEVRAQPGPVGEVARDGDDGRVEMVRRSGPSREHGHPPARERHDRPQPEVGANDRDILRQVRELRGRRADRDDQVGDQNAVRIEVRAQIVGSACDEDPSVDVDRRDRRAAAVEHDDVGPPLRRERRSGEARGPLHGLPIAIKAALTGHLVLSTLHTNDAVGGITRLIDMGVEPFLISSTLEAVLGQRLLRSICRNCRTSYEPNTNTLDQLGLGRRDLGEKKFYYGKGCDACNQTGYKGRKGIYELMRISDPLRELINERAPTVTLKQKAIELGMITLRQDGLRSVFDGNTTVEEVLKYT